MKRSLSILLCLGLAGPALAASGSVQSADRDRARAMLRNIKGELAKNYYDPGFHGLDLEARFKAAEEKIERAGSLGQLMGIIAQAVLDLEDSHCFFIPPGRTVSVDYGWSIAMVGERCLVLDLKHTSDAWAQGIRPGDEVVELQGYSPTRENMWKIQYMLQTLRPQPGLNAVIRSPGGAPRPITFKSTVKQSKRVLDLTQGEDLWDEVRRWEDSIPAHEVKLVGDVAVWRMPMFDLERGEVRRLVGQARGHGGLVIDLRGNPGGVVDTLNAVTGALFDRDVKIADMKGRKETKPQVAHHDGDAFTGKLVALVDSRSGSAAEILARVLQLEKRGTVVGDRSAGAVMRSRWRPYELGFDRVVMYAVSITDADVIMTDGASLERHGVTPDVALLPTPEDVAAGRDPVLARAIELAGGHSDPAAAGKLFEKKER